MRQRSPSLHLLGLTCIAVLGMAPCVGAEPADIAVSMSSEAAHRAVAVSAPVLNAPATVQAAAHQTISIMATATDGDPGDILTITASGAPASLVLSHTPKVSPATATLSGTLGAGDVGSYSIAWTVNDGTGGTASETTQLTVTENHNPMVNAPATALGAEL